MNLLYLHAGRPEARKANLIQVAQMCTALSEIAAQVTLAVPAVRESSVEALLSLELGTRPPFRIHEYRTIGLIGRPQVLGSYLGVRRTLTALPGADLCVTRVPLFVNAALRAGRRVVFEAHDKRLHPGSRRLDALYERILLRASQAPELVRFVAISAALARHWIARGVPKNKVVVLHDGVSARAFADPKSRDDARKGLGIASDARLVTYAGSLYADRGIESILELAGRSPAATFMIVGGAPVEVERYRQAARAAALENIVFVGRVPHSQVPEYLLASDVLLMLWSNQTPTIDICSPLKVFEYMAAGRQIVGYGFPTIREVLTHGEDALLAAPDDLDALDALLKDALENPVEQMALTARRRVLRDYTWATRARRFLDGIQKDPDS